MSPDTAHAAPVVTAPGAPAEDAAAKLLAVENLSTTFVTPAGRVRAVEGVSLSIEAGKTLGIVGESGCGKTVLSKSVMNLLPRRNVEREGRVLLNGRDVTALSPKEMTDVWGVDMAMVFQDPMTSLNPVMRIGKQITESLRFHLGMSKDEANREGLALLRAVHIPEPKRRFSEYPHQLSGGLRQRVMIAIALACSPKLLMADEPTTALDVTVQAQILDLLEELQAEREMGMILVTHDLGVVAGRTDEIAVMYAGQIVEKAPTPVLFAEMRMPYTEALLQSIPRLENPSHHRYTVIPGRPPDLISPPSGCRFAARCSYVQAKCVREAPPLRDAGNGHSFACWFPVGTPEGEEALERNLREGRVPGEVVIEIARQIAREEAEAKT
jgi:peptide/nickel transport system ATP-binding protein